MKGFYFNKVLLSISFVTLSLAFHAQEITKESIQGLWTICGAFDIDETLDTLVFSRDTPQCRKDECATYNWKFLPSGTVTFIFTDGCDSGFHSKNKPSKKWLLKSSKKQLIFITYDGWKEIFDIVSIDDDHMTIVHRFDLQD